MLSTADELTYQITVISSYKSKSLHGRAFYVTRETKYSRYHQSCLPTPLSFGHMCLAFLWPWFCLVSGGVRPVHMKEILRDWCFSRAVTRSAWEEEGYEPLNFLIPQTKKLRCTCVHVFSVIPQRQYSRHPTFLGCFPFHWPAISPWFHNWTIYCCGTLISGSSGKSIAIGERGWFIY